MWSVPFLYFGSALPAATQINGQETPLFSAASYKDSDVITRDVAIIGGGASGTYGTIKLKDMGKSVVVVERENRLGGHENTYTDPKTGTKIDYGVQGYWNISVTVDFFERFNIPIEEYTFGSNTNVFANFMTGSPLTDFTAGSNFNFTPYQNQLDKYPYLSNSWSLPNPVPQDLLLPFSDFINKYKLEDLAFSIYSNSLGIGDFLKQLTVNVFQGFGESYIAAFSGGVVTAADHDSSAIYVKALAELGSNALLSSSVIAAQRPTNSKSSVKLIVKTPRANKLIIAKKILITIPPLVHTLQPFGIDSQERDLFKEWTYSGYYVGVVRNTGLPANTRFFNAATNTPYNIPALPAVYDLVPTSVPDIFYYCYGSIQPVSQKKVESDVANVIQRLKAHSNSTASAGSPEFVAFNSHTPFKLVASADAIAGGFYNRLGNLQGHRNTFWTGAAFLEHSSGNLWNFTQTLLPRIVADM